MSGLKIIPFGRRKAKSYLRLPTWLWLGVKMQERHFGIINDIDAKASFFLFFCIDCSIRVFENRNERNTDPISMTLYRGKEWIQNEEKDAFAFISWSFPEWMWLKRI